MIKFNNVAKTYPGNTRPALSGVNLDIKDGEFFCIVGPSGCGKSTVLKIIANLEKQDSGEVNMPENIAMVFQSGALFPWLTVEENVELPLKIKKFAPSKVKEISSKYIFMTGLSAFAKKYPRELSGGQRQRVGIARALAVEPQVLLLDEPFSALDTITTDELHKDLLKIWQETKKAIVMVSHSIDEAVVLADRIALMKAGRIEEIFNITLPRPRREQEALFIHDVHKIRNAFLK